MSIKTPSSLKWLITRYQSVLQRCAEVEGLITQLETERQALTYQATCLENVISLHEVPIEPSDIKVPAVRRKRTNLPHGAVTKLIYECLGRIPIGTDISVTEIYEYVLSRVDWDSFDENKLKDLRHATRMRLKSMASSGKIGCSHKNVDGCESRYYLDEFYLE